MISLRKYPLKRINSRGFRVIYYNPIYRLVFISNEEVNQQTGWQKIVKEMCVEYSVDRTFIISYLEFDKVANLISEKVYLNEVIIVGCKRHYGKTNFTDYEKLRSFFNLTTSLYPRRILNCQNQTSNLLSDIQSNYPQSCGSQSSTTGNSYQQIEKDVNPYTNIPPLYEPPNEIQKIDSGSDDKVRKLIEETIFEQRKTQCEFDSELNEILFLDTTSDTSHSHSLVTSEIDINKTRQSKNFTPSPLEATTTLSHHQQQLKHKSPTPHSPLPSLLYNYPQAFTTVKVVPQSPNHQNFTSQLNPQPQSFPSYHQAAESYNRPYQTNILPHNPQMNISQTHHPLGVSHPYISSSAQTHILKSERQDRGRVSPVRIGRQVTNPPAVFSGKPYHHQIHQNTNRSSHTVTSPSNIPESISQSFVRRYNTIINQPHQSVTTHRMLHSPTIPVEYHPRQAQQSNYPRYIPARQRYIQQPRGPHPFGPNQRFS